MLTKLATLRPLSQYDQPQVPAEEPLCQQRRHIGGVHARKKGVGLLEPEVLDQPGQADNVLPGSKVTTVFTGAKVDQSNVLQDGIPVRAAPCVTSRSTACPRSASPQSLS